MLLEAAAAGFAFVAVAAVALAILGARAPVRAAEQRIRGLSRAPAEGPGLEGTDLLTRRGSPLPVMRRFIARNESWSARTAIDLQQAGLQLRVSEYLLLRLLVGGVAGIVVFVLFQLSPLGLLLGLVMGIVGFMAPMLWVKMRKARRQARITEQLAETLQLIANALRSGFAFNQAVELAANQMDAPIKDELNYFLRDTSLGARPEDALTAMVVRSGSIDLEMLVTTILVQRTTGGNLSEVLDNVSETIRERSRLRGEIKALTATQRLTGTILSLYPIVLGGLLFALAPSLMKVLLTEEVGRILLAIAVTLQVLGALAIRRILSLDV
jgi:tight adherence protein B